MAGERLTSVEHHVLAKLQAAGRPMALSELKNSAGLNLALKSREKLKLAGLVAARKVRNPSTQRGAGVNGLELTKAGAAWLAANGPPTVEPYDPAACSALLVLMAENRPIPTAELKDQFGITLKKASLDRLKRDRLIEASRTGDLELTDSGWAWVARQAASGEAAPKGLAPLYAMLRSVHRFMDVNQLALAHVFGGEPLPAVAAVTTEDVEGLIREAYRGLARSREDFVPLADLRDRLPRAVPRKAVDDALVRMFMQDHTHLRPNENTKSITPRDAAAAIRLGEKDRHYIRVR